MTGSRALQGWRAPLAVLLLAGGYWILDLWVLGSGPPHPLDDIWEDGLVARSLASGEGLRTSVVYPPLWALRDSATTTVPVLVHGPLLPLALVAPLRWFGPGLLDHLAWLAAALAVVMAAQVQRLARRWFDEGTAVAAAGLLTLSPVLLRAVHHSLSVVVGGCLLLAACDLAWRERPRALWGGFSLGLCYLVRPEMLLAAPILAVSCGGIGAAARFGAGFVLIAAGWWWHQWRAVGVPWFNLSSYTLLAFTPSWPEYSVLRSFDLTPDRWPAALRDALPDLWPKWLRNLPRAAWHALGTTGPTTGWLALVGVAAAARRLRRAWVGAAILVAAIPLAMWTLTQPVPLYAVSFLGLYAVAAGHGAVRLARRLGPPSAVSRHAWVALVALALAATLPALWRAGEEGRRTAALLVAERRELSALSGSAGRSVVFSDRPDFVAWTTGRPALYVSRAEYERLYPAALPGEAGRPHGLPPERRPRDTWFHSGHWALGEQAR
jgi:hypothetical protein